MKVKVTTQTQNEERMEQIDLEKIETDDNCAFFDNWHYVFHYFFWDDRFIVEKITECTSKLASLYDSMTNVEAKCTK